MNKAIHSITSCMLLTPPHKIHQWTLVALTIVIWALYTKIWHELRFLWLQTFQCPLCSPSNWVIDSSVGRNLICFHRWEKIVDEAEWRNKPNCASCQHNSNHHEEWVPNVEGRRYWSTQALEVKNKIVDRVQENVDCHRSRWEERLPPPFPVLNAKVHVSQNQWNLSADNNEEQQDNEEESKNIVHTTHPYAWHDEEELDE